MQPNDLQVEIWKIEQIVPYVRNAQAHDDANIAAIAGSIVEYGWTYPILVDEEGVILAGHGRLAACMRLGLSVAPVIVKRGLSAAQKCAYRLADNKLTKNTPWDEGLLRVELADLREGGYDLGLTGFGDEELRELFASDDAQMIDDPGAELNRAEELRQKWGVEVGQLWTLGNHRLLCGDSTDVVTWERLMGRDVAVMAVTSPPYGVGKSYEQKGIEAWRKTMQPVIEHLCRFARIVVWQIGDLYATGSQFIEPTLAYSMEMFRAHQYRPLWLRVWEKQGINFSGSPYHLVSNKPAQQYEHILAVEADELSDAAAAMDVMEYEWVSAFAGSQHRFVKRLSKAEAKAWGYAGVWKINTVLANNDHPAMFPLELPERCIKLHSSTGDLVAEPFSGSGTTLIACERLGRLCRAIELNPGYVAVALERWHGATGKTPVREL